jgi:hypothetical protein
MFWTCENKFLRNPVSGYRLKARIGMKITAIK